MTGSATPYNPWHDLRDNWPEVQVVFEPMTGSLLGELRYPVIALRAGTSAAQRRCTLAHEIVHLERGLPFAAGLDPREERWVSATAARRLVAVDALAAALREAGPCTPLPVVAAALRVDGDTLRLRIDLLTAEERRFVAASVASTGWAVA